MIVRLGTDADKPGVAAIDQVAWDATSTPAELPLSGDWAGEVDPAELTIAEVDGRVAGYVLLSPHNKLGSAAHIGLIRGIAVHPDFRGQGIGRAMLDATFDHARARGFEKLLLNMLITNTGARALYRAAGFREIGRVADHFRIHGQRVADLLLERVLVPDETPPEALSGGCHCGAVRFRVTVRRWELLDCNCSICSKKGILHLIVDDADFELVQGADALATYRFGTGIAKHHFCRTCGIHPFYRPRSHPDGWDVNARCLDDDGVDRFAVVGFDGRNWEARVDSIR